MEFNKNRITLLLYRSQIRKLRFNKKSNKKCNRRLNKKPNKKYNRRKNLWSQNSPSPKLKLKIKIIH